MTLNIVTPIFYGGEHRLSYFKKYIEHVNKLNYLDKCHFIFPVEPNSQNMVDLIPKHWSKTLLINYYKFGPVLNHYIGFKYCFDVLKLDYVFLLEDDIICSPDLYNLSAYCLKNNLLEDSLLCTLNKHRLFNQNHELYKNKNNSVLLSLTGKEYLSCWGTGISKSFWCNYMFNNWRMDIPFDTMLYTKLQTCKVISPLISRTNQIGEIGVHYSSEEWQSHGFSDIVISSNYTDDLYTLEYV